MDALLMRKLTILFILIQFTATGCVPALNPDAVVGAELQTIVSAASGEFAWQADSGFGFAVAMSGSTLVVGAPFAGGPGAGAVFVFERDGDRWAPVQRLTTPEPREHNFGYSVAIDGDVLVVGAPRAARLQPGPVPSIRGAAYTFQRTTDGWRPSGELVSDDPAPGDRYGWAVSLSGMTAVVGGAMKAYVFVGRRGGGVLAWPQQQALEPTGSHEAVQFGNAVAVSGDVAVVGDPYATPRVPANASAWGAAWVFRRTGTEWTAVDLLTAADNARDGDLFGHAVAVRDGHAAAGAPWAAAGAGTHAGKSFVYHDDGSRWRQQRRLTAMTPFQGQFYGSAVAITSEYALVGAPGSTSFSGASANGGFTYVYQRDGDAWQPRAFLPGSSRARTDRFGWATALSGDIAAVGAPGFREGQGAVHLFTLRRLGAAGGG